MFEARLSGSGANKPYPINIKYKCKIQMFEARLSGSGANKPYAINIKYKYNYKIEWSGL